MRVSAVALGACLVVCGCSGSAGNAPDGGAAGRDAAVTSAGGAGAGGAGRAGSGGRPAADGGRSGGGAGGRGGAGAGGAGSGNSGGADGFAAGPKGCQALALEPNVSLDGYAVDRYAWSDAACARRSAALVHNDADDPGGSAGGYLRQLVWEAGGTKRTATGTGSSGWNGWGYVVNHYASTADTSQRRPGEFRTVLAGTHHAIHEFKLQMSPGGPVDVTIHWFFATGRSAPLYAISFDATAAGQDAVTADTRAPYGDLAFEGEAADIGGVGWGDKYRFVSTGDGPLTMNTAWTYQEPNVVPFVRLWSQASDAEMGAVQTLSFDRQIAGGDYGGGILASDCWGKTSDNRGPNCVKDGDTMPQDWLWPFQLNQYELPFTTLSHRLAWGSTYGMVGQHAVSAFGQTLSGYPRLSYSVYLVVDPKSATPTIGVAGGVERALGAKWTATRGSVAASGPAGVGRSDEVGYTPAGYDPIYGVWRLVAADGGVTAKLDPAGGALVAPVIRVAGWSKPGAPSVKVNGAAFAGDQFFATVDSVEHVLWLTLNGTVSKPIELSVD